MSIPLGYPTLKLKGDYFAIATLGFAEAVRLIIENLEKITGGSRGIPGIPTRTTLPIVLVVTLVFVWIIRNYVSSRHGAITVWPCARMNWPPRPSPLIPSATSKFHFAINGLLGGLSGAFLAHYVGFIQPSMFGIQKSTELIVMVIFGGMHSVTGAVLAAIILTALPEVLRAASAWRLVAYGAVVLLIMLTRPEGLLGSWEVSRESLQELWHSLQTRLAKAKV